MVAKPHEMLSFVLAPWEGAHSPGLETLEGERVQVGTDLDLSQEPSVRCGERSPSPGGTYSGGENSSLSQESSQVVGGGLLSLGSGNSRTDPALIHGEDCSVAGGMQSSSSGTTSLMGEVD